MWLVRGPARRRDWQDAEPPSAHARPGACRTPSQSLGRGDGQPPEAFHCLRQRNLCLRRQSVETTEAAGPCGYDAGKKVKGRKRHAMVDTDGRLLVAQISAACTQDRDGAMPLLQAPRRSFPFSSAASSTAPTLRIAPSRRPASPSRSCASRGIRLGSPSIHGAGSNACSPGPAATAGLPRTSRPPSPPPSPSSTPHHPCFQFDASLVALEFRVGLRMMRHFRVGSP